MTVRAVQTKQGWYVKATPSGAPYPLDSRLAPLFRQANVTTLGDAISFGAQRHGDKPCMATRTLLAREWVDSGDGVRLEKLVLGEYTWLNYLQVQQMVTKAGQGIRQLGVRPFDRVAFFAETRAEWLVAALACMQHRVTVATLYTTLPDEGILHGIMETQVSCVFTTHQLLPRLKGILGQCRRVKTVVVMEDQLEGVGSLSGLPQRVQVVPFKDLLKVQRLATPIEAPKPQADDIAILMYTSGSTGTPKGVELTHTNILTSVIAYSVQMNIGPQDRYMAFLPLAHIMELATEIALISLGVGILYSSPYTLTSSSLKVKEGCEGDAKVARPTVLNAVPLILDRILKQVFAKVEQQGRVQSLVFKTAVRTKPWLDHVPFASRLVNALVFRKVQEELGGELRRMVVGGAPLAPQTHDAIRAIFGVSLQVGYGAAETASCISGMDEDDVVTGQTGGPNLGVLLRLQDWEEGDYRVTDQPNPRGELVVGGPVVAKGYFRLPRQTKDAFFEEDGVRWFRTGDIGEMNSLGCVRIIDRMKDLVKLKHGEYVSLGNTESILKAMPGVENICVFADSTKASTVAVVVTPPQYLQKVAAEVGIQEGTLTIDQLCQDQRVTEAFLATLQSHGRKCGLTRWEIPAAICLTTEEWTPDTGLVTAALKLRRKQLGDYYADVVHEMYASLDQLSAGAGK